MKLKKFDTASDAIGYVRSKLSWAVHEEKEGGKYFQIISDPVEKTHRILYPNEDARSGPPRETELLHELVHAYLAETVHYLFSTNIFKRGTDEWLIRRVTWACRSAADWFVDDILMHLIPEIEAQEIKEHLDVVLTHIHNPEMQRSTTYNIFTAFLVAQAEKYLGLKSAVPSFVGKITRAFLTTSPKKPALDNLVLLINKILAADTAHMVQLADGVSLQIKVVQDGSLGVFQIVRR